MGQSGVFFRIFSDCRFNQQYSMNKVLLFNPRSANYKPRIPNSILSIASSIEGLYDYVIVDGNLETDPWGKIHHYLSQGGFRYFGCTSMPGPQLKQSIPISKKIRELYPDMVIIWGGYFPSNQPKTVLLSGYVDFVMNGPGERSFPKLLNTLEENNSQPDLPIGRSYH
jgi:anaerobic magnesium-protoporphyrin IX monomethyl ester cyclase